MTTICVSGGFDPLHAGHVRLFEAAAKHGEVTVILNSDSWLITKKGWWFQKWSDRAEILLSIGHVKRVVPVDDGDGTVCEALGRLRPDYFGKSADRTRETTPETALCDELGIKMLFDLVPNWQSSGTKLSSSDIVKRGWGEYRVLDVTGGWKVKELTIHPGMAISRQYHRHRAEHWFVVRGRGFATLKDSGAGLVEIPYEKRFLGPGSHVNIPPCCEHRVEAADGILTLIEVQTGEICEEEDIVRLPEPQVVAAPEV